MRFTERTSAPGKRPGVARSLVLLLALLALSVFNSGCNGLPDPSKQPPTQPAPQTYMAPYMVGAQSTPGSVIAAYQIDDAASTFNKSTYLVSSTQQGIQISYSGTTSPLSNGLLSLDVEYTYANLPAAASGFAFELPNQAGGLIQLQNQAVQPLVPATSCPAASQTYNFLTLLAPMQIGGGGAVPFTWDPTQEAVYGSVGISGSGSTVTLSNIQQYTFPSISNAPPYTLGTAAPPLAPYAAASPQTGACSSGYYGNTTIVPAEPATGSQPGSSPVVQPYSLVGIGPTGLLVQSNAANGEPDSPPYNVPPLYQNLLGAGTGAIGLPQPSSAIDSSTLAGGNYLGFFYGGGDSSTDTSTIVASFSYSSGSVSSACQKATGVPGTSTSVIYGGSYPSNDPVSATNAPCNAAIDLGQPDSNNKGFYPNVTVYFGGQFWGNGYGAQYSFPAIAIAGQLGGEYAIFVLGIDQTGAPNQAWGIYLFQSN